MRMDARVRVVWVLAFMLYGCSRSSCMGARVCLVWVLVFVLYGCSRLSCMDARVRVLRVLAFVSASVLGLEEVAAKALASGKKGMTGLPGEGGESLVAEMRIG